MKGIKLDSRQITKGLIIIGTVLTLIYIVHLMTSKKEKNTNSYFNTPNDATNQKIMTVNQSTGEINFLDKSVKTINDDLVDDYATIKSAMVVLLGENLRGDTDGKIYELARDKADKSWAEDELDTKQNTISDLGDYIKYGASVKLRIMNKTLSDEKCDNFENSNSAWNIENNARWCANSGPAGASTMNILKG